MIQPPIPTGPAHRSPSELTLQLTETQRWFVLLDPAANREIPEGELSLALIDAMNKQLQPGAARDERISVCVRVNVRATAHRA